MIKINPKSLKEKIALAKAAVEGEEEPYKTEAFRIIFAQLLGTTQTQSKKNTQNTKDHEYKAITNLDEKKEDLARRCNITLDQLNDVIAIHDNVIEIISPIGGSDAQKHIMATQIALIAYEVILDADWVPSSKIVECLRRIGVKDLGNLSLNLRRYPHLIRSSGTRGHKEYKLTSGDGRRSAYQIINKLSKGEKI